MSPDKSEPRVYCSSWIGTGKSPTPFRECPELLPPNTLAVTKKDYDQAIQLKDARIAELEAEVKQEYIDNASREKEIVAHNAELQQKLTEAHDEIQVLKEEIQSLECDLDAETNLKATEE